MIKKLTEQLDKIDDIGKATEQLEKSAKQPKKLFAAAKEAYKKAKESKDKRWYQKIGIWWREFRLAMKGVESEEKTATDDADETVSESVEESMKGFSSATELDGSVNDLDKKYWSNHLSIVAGSFHSLDTTNQKRAQAAYKKLLKAQEGEDVDPFSFEQTAAFTAMGLDTLSKLKAKYQTKEKIAAALKRIMDLSEKSKFNFTKFMSKSVVKVFNLKDQSEQVKFLNAFGIQLDAADAATGFTGIGKGGEATKAGKLLKSLTKRPLRNKSGIVSFFKKRILPNTPKENIASVVTIINQLASGKKKSLTPDVFAELIYKIDKADYKYLIRALVGKKGTQLDKAA